MEGYMTATTSRRAVLAGVAAVPALSLPAIAATLDRYKFDPVATLARVREIVDRLETCYICDGWVPDREGNARLLRYFEWSVANPEESLDDVSDEWSWVLKFIHDNGQSIDWVLYGEPGGPVCKGAAHSRRADAELLELGRKFDARVALYEEARRRWEPNWEAKERAVAAKPGCTAMEMFAIHAQIDREIPVADPHPDDFFDRDLEALQHRIMDMPAHTPAGLAVKARVVRFAVPDYWDAPEKDRDWDKRMVTKLVDALDRPVQS
jgi:hypothetical protein